jgi:hypothetical protein
VFLSRRKTMLATNSTLSLQRKFTHNEFTHPILDVKGKLILDVKGKSILDVKDEVHRITRMVYDKLYQNWYR